MSAYLLISQDGSRLLASSTSALITAQTIDAQPYIITFGRLETPWAFGRLESPWTFGGLQPMSSIPSIATEYRRVPVSATDSGAAVNVSTGTVTMAFVAVGTEPDTGDWKTASWETDATRTPNRYYARCLIGSAVTLTDGTYDVWIQITGIGSQVVKERVSQLVVT